MKRTVSALVMALAVFQIAPSAGTISGSVIKARTAIQQPLRNARLEVTGGAASQVVARTDANGRFVFPNLAAGEYRLAVTCDGFIRQEYPKKIVLTRGQQVGNIVFEMDPAPTAAGRVLDSYGEPISNIVVEALRRSYDVRGNPRLARAAAAVTDDRGEYRVYWLDPGEYFFFATSPLPQGTEGPPPRVFTPTYFPGVNAPEDAMPVRLDIGREIRVDFRLRDASLWSVNGQTMNGTTGRSIGAAITLTPPAEDPNLSRYRTQSSATGLFSGQFAIGQVPPGSYILRATSGSGDQEITAFERIVLRPMLMTPNLGYTAHLSLIPPASINGRLYFESREPVDLRGVGVELLAADPDLPSPRRVPPRSDGQFTVSGVVPGSYLVEIYNLPGDLYLKAARFGDADILSEPLTLGKNDAKPLQILLGSDGGRLQVAAYNPNGEIQPSAQFALVPDPTRRSRREQFRVAASGEDGRATFRGIPPGSYTLFAWEHMEPNAYLNSDYLRPYENFGTPVKIASGDNPPISARLIPRE